MRLIQNIFWVTGCMLFTGCSLQKNIAKTAQKNLLTQQALQQAHIGICIYEPATNRFWFNYQADKYFVPASNTKLATLYAGLTCLPDSLPGLHYTEDENNIIIEPTGDPTFLHPDFNEQPVAVWLKQTSKKIFISSTNWQEKQLGFGWSWDDYNAAYMPERSALPLYGNIVKWTQVKEQVKEIAGNDDAFVYSQPEVNWKVNFNSKKAGAFSVVRKRDENVFEITEGKELLRTVEVPFVTNGINAALELLPDTIMKSIAVTEKKPNNPKTKFSQLRDSMFSLMMHRSDNFFAEQTLLMAANEKTGIMNDEKIIDTLLKTSLKDFPQKPAWVDGSGLSRYNLFTPHDFVWLLNKLKTENKWQTLTAILPTGNSGTLKNYYTALANKLYAKTGTLSGHVAISGYLTTHNNKQLIFSVLVNNHQTSATVVKRAVEKLILAIYNRY
jgi:serine-type D-Ala-D-Ala carboxypeptidase/endopeptidase (penicillin-binding protein 4)